MRTTGAIASGASVNPESLRIFLAHITAWGIMVGGFWFLYEALLDTNTAAIPEGQLGIVIGLVGALMTAAATYVFGAAAFSAASNSSRRATEAGVNAALTVPPSNGGTRE